MHPVEGNTIHVLYNISFRVPKQVAESSHYEYIVFSLHVHSERCLREAYAKNGFREEF